MRHIYHTFIGLLFVWFNGRKQKSWEVYKKVDPLTIISVKIECLVVASLNFCAFGCHSHLDFQPLNVQEKRRERRCQGVWRCVCGCVCVGAVMYSHNTRTHILETALNYGNSLYYTLLYTSQKQQANPCLFPSLSPSLSRTHTHTGARSFASTPRQLFKVF